MFEINTVGLVDPAIFKQTQTHQHVGRSEKIYERKENIKIIREEIENKVKKVNDTQKEVRKVREEKSGMEFNKEKHDSLSVDLETSELDLKTSELKLQNIIKEETDILFRCMQITSKVKSIVEGSHSHNTIPVGYSAENKEIFQSIRKRLKNLDRKIEKTLKAQEESIEKIKKYDTLNINDEIKKFIEGINLHVTELFEIYEDLNSSAKNEKSEESKEIEETIEKIQHKKAIVIDTINYLITQHEYLSKPVQPTIPAEKPLQAALLLNSSENSSRKPNFESIDSKGFQASAGTAVVQQASEPVQQASEPVQQASEPVQQASVSVFQPTAEIILENAIIKGEEEENLVYMAENEVKKFKRTIEQGEKNNQLFPQANAVLCEAKILIEKYKKRNDINTIKSLKDSLITCNDLYKNLSFKNIKTVNENAEKISGSSSALKKFAGSMFILGGLALIAISIISLVTSFGASTIPSAIGTKAGIGLVSLGAGIIGTASTIGGSFLFHKGLSTGLSKEMQKFSKIADNQIERSPNPVGIADSYGNT